MTSRPVIPPRLSGRRLVAWSAVVWAIAAAPALGQCPDGSQPPCATALATRPTRALDPRTWVVLPFTNVTRDSATSWLGEASVNLLYLELSRWDDIRVIDDGRVFDAVRTVPAARRDPLGLSAGLELARKLGAGRMVMGDVVHGGAETRLVAKVYDVGSGSRLRTVQDGFTTREATLPAISRLAGKVVDAPLPHGASPEAVGTHSLDAYQAYAAGLAALYRWRLDEAEEAFRRAIAADSTFALAQYRLSITRGWRAGPDSSIAPPAEAAARLAGGLPARERALIRGQELFVHGGYDDACDVFKNLVAADSSDVEGWYQLGECSFHGSRLMPVGPDSLTWDDGGRYTTAYRAFLRTLDLDPDMHLAYEHLLDMLRTEQMTWCMNEGCTVGVTSAVELRGDTVNRTGTGTRSARVWVPQDTLVRRRNLEAAATLAERWAVAEPEGAVPHYQYGLILSDLRRYAAAAPEFATARRLGLTRQPQGESAFLQLNALLLADSAALRTIPAAVAIADSFVRGLRITDPPEPTALWVRADTADRRQNLAVLSGLLGQPSRVPPQPPPTPGISRWGADTTPLPDGFYRAVVLLAAGVTPGDLDHVLAEAMLPSANSTLRGAVPIVVGQLCAGRCSVPGAETDSVWRGSVWGTLLRGDTAAARGYLSGDEARLGPTPPIEQLFAMAQAHLALADSAGALALLARVDVDPWRANIAVYSWGYPLLSPTWLLGRVWLLRADLLAAAGRQDQARLDYRRAADLWALADPEIQPQARRARSKLP